MANYNIDAIYNGNTSLPGTERVRIDSSGNIGIGTATPSTKLHIYENANRVTYISQNDNHTARFEAYGTATAIDTTASNGIFFRINSGDIVKFAADGNVGIGTSTARAPLDIYRASNPFIRVNGGGAYSYIQMDDGTSTGYLIKNTSSGTSNGALAGAMYTYTDSGKAFQHIHASTPLFTILSGGNVGIGTTSPAYKLEVNGNFAAGGTSTIGTTYPQLTLNGTTNQHAYLIINRTNYESGIQFQTSGTTKWWMYMPSGNDAALRFYTNQNSSGDILNLTNTGNVGIGTTSPVAKLDINGTSNFAANVYHSVGGQKFFAGSGGTYSYFYTGTTALNIINSNDTSTLITILNGGNVGIGTTSPNKKLQIIGSFGKGLNLYEVPIDNLGAVGTQAKRYEIARVFIDYNDWNNTGPVEIEVRESYYSDGRYKRYLFSYGYNSNNAGSLWLVEDAGRGANDFKAEVGSAAQVSGDIYYVPIYIDLDYYQYVDVLVRTNRPRTTNASSASGGVIYINESPTGSNISSFSPDEVTYISLASSKTYLGYSGNVGIGTSSPAQKLHIDTSTGTLATRDNGDGALWSTLSTSKTIGLSSGDNYAQSSNYSWMKITGGASGSIQFAVNSLTMTIVDGKVGIGTTSPASPLTAQSNANQLRLQTTSGPTSYFANIGSRYDSARPFTIEVANGASTATEYFGIYADSGGANNRIALLNGSVGIGTTAPAYKLDVYQTSNDSVIRSKTTTAGAYVYLDSGTDGYFGVNLVNAGTGKWFMGSYGTTSFTITKGIADTEYFRINTNGNVGIGTSSPKQKLDVSGAGGKIAITNTGTTDYSELVFYEGNSVKADIWVNGSTQATYAGVNSMNILQNSNAPIVFYTNGINERMRISADGNVGIGTSSPVQKLSVVGNIYLPQGNYITWNNGDCEIGGIFGYHLVFRTYTGVSMTEKLRIESDGNVGIGTTIPLYKLDVNGSVNANNIRTTTQIGGTTGTIQSFVTPGIYSNASSTGNAIAISSNTTFANQGAWANLGLHQTTSNANDLTAKVYLGIGGWYQNSGTGIPVYIGGGFSSNSSSVLSVVPVDAAGNGNVGIGTTNPSQKLDVNGTIKATSYIGDFTGRLVRTSTTQTITGNSALTIDVAAAYIHVITVAASGGIFGISSVTYNNRKANPEVDEIILIFKWPASGSGSVNISNTIGDIPFNYGKATVTRLTSYKGTTGFWIAETVASNIDYTNL